jgi:hypothetical protein
MYLRGRSGIKLVVLGSATTRELRRLDEQKEVERLLAASRCLRYRKPLDWT